MNILLLGLPGAAQAGMREPISTSLFGLFTSHSASCKCQMSGGDKPGFESKAWMWGSQVEFSALWQYLEGLCPGDMYLNAYTFSKIKE